MSASLSRQTKVGKSVWDDYGTDPRLAEMSHWRGYGRYKDEAVWLRIGEGSVRRINTILRTEKIKDFWAKPRVVLEWGSGGGANAIAFRDHAKAYYGVDISKQNLNEAARVMREANSSIFKPALIDSGPKDVLSAVKQKIDVFISTAVFQHFPSKEYGVEVLSVLAKLCHTGALGFIQIRFADSGGRISGNASVDEYKKNYLQATVYAIDEFWTICENAGFAVRAVTDLKTSNNYVTFHLRKKPKPDEASNDKPSPKAETKAVSKKTTTASDYIVPDPDEY